ncbi:MAG: hypothetical protein U1F54_07580 [Burkholderiales bacterium]
MYLHELNAGGHISATPAGAYYATRSDEDESARAFLLRLLARDPTPRLSPDAMRDLSASTDDARSLEMLYRMQSLALVQRDAGAKHPPAGSLESLLPSLLAKLSDSGKTLLADHQGFYIATAGFPHETAEELSALSADVATLHARHARLIHGNLNLAGANWGLIDAAGNAQLGIWNLYCGRSRFALVLAGNPRFNQEAFVDLVWLLVMRYGAAA